jgi:hypothetical protein
MTTTTATSLSGSRKISKMQSDGAFRLPAVEITYDSSNAEKSAATVLLEQRQKKFWTSANKTRAV